MTARGETNLLIIIPWSPEKHSKVMSKGLMEIYVRFEMRNGGWNQDATK